MTYVRSQESQREPVSHPLASSPTELSVPFPRPMGTLVSTAPISDLSQLKLPYSVPKFIRLIYSFRNVFAC